MYRHYEQLSDSTVVALMLEDRAAAEAAERADDAPRALRFWAQEEEAFDILVARGREPLSTGSVKALRAARAKALRRVADGHPYGEQDPMEAVRFVRPVL